MATPINYFYDGQIRRYLLQIVRAYSGYKYMVGSLNGNPPYEQVVPARMGTTNRVVASIINNQTDNSLNSAPLITVSLIGVSGIRSALQNQAHVDTRQVTERAIDPVTKEYTGARGKSYTIKRLMPIPLMLTIQVDLWTTNTEQKLEIFEQIQRTTYPDFDLQNSENGLDWGAQGRVTVRDDVNWSSRTIPIGTTEEIDVLTWNLEVQIYLSPPAIVTQQAVIEQIVTNLTDDAPSPGIQTDGYSHNLAQIVTSPGNHHIRVDGNVITLLGDNGRDTDHEGNTYSWEKLLWDYGNLRPATSQLSLVMGNDIETVTIHGTLQANPNKENELFWQVDPDTLPANTLPPIEAIIDPMRTYPGNGITPVNGLRYMILQDIGVSQVWGNIEAKYGDIIEYQNGAWLRTFDGSSTTTPQYVLNLNKGYQLRWNGEDWILVINGEYPPGYWRLSL